MKRYLFLLAVSGAAIIGCKKSEILSYNAGEHMQFTKSYADSVNFSFIKYPGATSVEYPIRLEISDVAHNKDQVYRVVVDTEKSTAIEGVHFSLPEEMVFRSGHYADTCFVKLLKTADMTNKTYRLVLKLEPQGVIKSGQSNYMTNVINISSKIVQPDWWISTDIQIIYFLLGNYSDKKYELFIDVTGVADLDGVPYSVIRGYALEFTYYLVNQHNAGNTIYESDETTRMVTPLMNGLV